VPLIEAFTCNECDFKLPTGWGGYVYATDAEGKRIVCPHPGEGYAIQRITGLTYEDADAAGRVGFNSDCICLACLEQFKLDLKRDPRDCPACKSHEVKSTKELIDQPCPACRKGTVRRGSPIRWPLDPDRASLPVPQIVKDFCEYAETREVPASLQEAQAAIKTIPGTKKHDLFIVCIHLLGWWQGEFFERDSEQAKSLGPYELKWPWVQAFRAAVDCTPGLNRLIRWSDGSWFFRDEITAAELRGIKNYTREHYKPPLMS
jgi:hypothetical protein